MKSDHNQNFWYIQNNHIKIKKFLRPIQSWSANSEKIAVRSSPDPAKIDFSPDPCSPLVSSR